MIATGLDDGRGASAIRDEEPARREPQVRSAESHAPRRRWRRSRQPAAEDGIAIQAELATSLPSAEEFGKDADFDSPFEDEFDVPPSCAGTKAATRTNRELPAFLRRSAD